MTKEEQLIELLAEALVERVLAIEQEEIDKLIKA